VYEQLEKAVMNILPEVQYQRVEDAYCPRQDCMIRMQALIEMLEEIPMKGGWEESRLRILLSAAEASIAAADSLVISIPKEEAMYKEQAADWRNQIDEARSRVLYLTGEIVNDELFPEIKVSDLMSVVKSKVKFARLCLSREGFYKGSNIPIPDDERVKSGVPLCFLITVRNYGNIEAEHVKIQEICDGFTTFIQRKEQEDASVPVLCEDFVYKVYDPSDKSCDAYHTDINNESGCTPIMAYIGTSPDFDMMAKEYAKEQQLESL